MKKLFSLVAVATMAFSVLQAKAEQFRILTSWDDTNYGVSLLAIPFMKDVEKVSGGKMTFVRSGPETVPPFEQLQPASAGIFQFLFTHGAYHFGTTPMGAAVDAISGNAEKQRAAGIRDWMDQHYQKFNLKLIAMATTDGRGYEMLLREPLTPQGDLAGRKIRGTPSYFGLLKLLGASPVVLPPSEVYSALEKGVVDGAAWPALGLEPTRWYEVARYLLRPTFGNASQLLFMNLDAWKALSPENQKILLEAGKKIEDIWWTAYEQKSKEEEQRLVNDHGMKIVELPAKFAADIEVAWDEGVWSIVDSKQPKQAEELRNLAKKAGLTK